MWRTDRYHTRKNGSSRALDVSARDTAWMKNPALLMVSRYHAETYRAALVETARLLTDVGRADGGQLAVDSEYIQIVARKQPSNSIS